MVFSIHARPLATDLTRTMINSGTDQSSGEIINSGRIMLQDFGDDCTDTSDCYEDTVCVDSSNMQTCGYDQGESCSNDDECGGGYVCNDQQICDDNFNYECSDGSECTNKLICSSGACSDNYDEPCSSDFDCSGSLVCSSSSSVCEALSEDTSDDYQPDESPSPAASHKPSSHPRPTSSDEVSATPSYSSSDFTGTATTYVFSIRAIVGIAVGGTFLLITLVMIALNCRPTHPPFRKSNIPWPPREFTDPRIQPEYMQFWYGPMHDKSQEVHRHWHPFLDTHGRNISPATCHPKELPGIYEFGLVHVSRRKCLPVVVYVGKAGGQKGLKGRHQAYANTNGDHLREYFEYAQRHGCLIYRRFVYDTIHAGGHHGSGDRAATQIETRFLSFFDYAFNTAANARPRSIYLKPRKWLHCFPAGIYIMNDKAEAPFPPQLPPKMPCFC